MQKTGDFLTIKAIPLGGETAFMNILGQTRKFVTKRILPIVKPKQQKLFSFGLQALTFTTYESLGSNARLVVENVSTAASKIYRLVSNKTILENFHRLLTHACLVSRQSVVNVDFSTFCGFQTLVFAVQTQCGRALPVWNNCITYPIEKVGSQNIFVLEQIQAFGKCLGFYPRFVFDRGFWIPCLMKFFLKEKIIFYLRIKAGQEFIWVNRAGKASRKAKKIGTYTKDTVIELFGYKMRLIVSPLPPKQTNPKKVQNIERWYIITNDMKTKREDILLIYKTRFEIEETFRDYKHIQRLKRLRIKTCQTFRILLWFASVAFWIAWWRDNATDPIQEIVSPKKTRSFFCIFWEELQRALRTEKLRYIATGLSPG